MYKVVIPIQTISFYNNIREIRKVNTFKVVIPIQTISFYNRNNGDMDSLVHVVIPIQTISFYNTWYALGGMILKSCHTYPNDKLLQHHHPLKGQQLQKLSYLSKR